MNPKTNIKSKLVILDPTLISLEGHSFNYVTYFSNQAKHYFDETIIFCDYRFKSHNDSYEKYIPDLNRGQILKVKELCNKLSWLFKPLFFFKNKKTINHATVDKRVPDGLIFFGELLSAFELLVHLFRWKKIYFNSNTTVFLQNFRKIELFSSM